MEVKAVSLYVSKKPIEVENPIPLPEHRHDDMIDSFQCSVNMKASRKILRCMTLVDRRNSRFMKQIILLKLNPKHNEAIFRCLRYGNKIPRKYQRKYKEVIKQMKMPWQRWK